MKRMNGITKIHVLGNGILCLRKKTIAEPSNIDGKISNVDQSFFLAEPYMLSTISIAKMIKTTFGINAKKLL